MKNYLVLGALAGLASVASAQTIVYNNTVTPALNTSGGVQFWGQAGVGAATGVEGGDRMALTGNDRKIQQVELRFQSSNTLPGTVDLRLRFYDNSPLMTGVDFYDSGWINFPEVSGANTYTFTLPNVPVPSIFSYSVEIQNRSDVTGAFGPQMFNPVSVGGSQSTFPAKIGGTWGIYQFTAPAIGNFGVKLTALAGDPALPTPPAGLYTQNPATTFTAGHSVSSVEGQLVAGSDFDRQHIDDFTVPTGGWTIASVGAWHQNDRGNPTSVDVEFYQESSPGVPSETPAHSFLNIPMSSVTEYYAGIFNANGLRHYRAALPSSVNLTPGKWFVRFQANSPFNHFWNATTTTNPIQGLNAHFRSGPTGLTDLGAIPPWPSTWTPTGVVIFTTASDRAFRLYAPENNVSGTVDFGQLTAAYNTGANLPTSIPVSFRDAGNSEIATGTASYNPVTGAFATTIPGAVTVPFRVSFKLGFWLRKTMPNPADPAAPLGNYNFGTVTPLVGDSDDDNEVTNFDYSLWAAANGNSVTANTDNDFDGDGEITNFDYSLWAANNGALGDN
ncbi:MAG TPA: hypothetical protein PLO61_09985 [Fimbriimonadaceae bacterium]|nr:hypothetical protein [Fimbriimonadaceae bacterium]HRJ33931.1 hypothetical protein [Fimbriimonadaceae bacterium]